MVLRKKSILLIMVFLIGGFVCACGKEDSVAGESLVEDTEEVSSTEETKNTEEEAAVQWEKGYDLPVDEQEREEAETDCKKLMELYLDIYETADKGIASNVVLDNQTVLEIQKKVKDAGYPIATMVTYSNMENYESVDSFLKECMEGKRGSVVIYEIHNDGGLGRMKFIFDGTDMYVVSTRGIWNADNKPGISYISYTRLKEWKYTEKGWFCYELCVPEPPEVSEIMDGSCLIRIKPMTEEQCEMSERCVRGLGYQGQNLLCSNWNVENMSELDYNGMFEYLYGMKYGEKFNSEDYPNGIPKEEFESLIMEYLPITAEQIREYAVFDEENQTYLWARLGCFNYAPTFFGTSLPEVVDIKENQDGTVTLTVEAVCDMVICDDAVITHELTVRFAEDGSFQYLGNEILNEENCSEEVEETLQAIADQREYEQEARMEIIESESGVKIRSRKEILKLFQDTIDEIYTDAVNKVYFDEGIEVLGECKLQDTVDEQLLFSITVRSGKELEIYGVIDIDDSEGTASVMQIRVYNADENIVNGDIEYVNGEAEYNIEQTSHMPVVMDSYDDGNAEIIKNAVDEFLEREREDEAIISHEEKRMAEEDWHADEMDTLESNQE